MSIQHRVFRHRLTTPTPPLPPLPKRCAKQQYIITAPGTDTLDLTVSDYHGRCNVVFVGTSMDTTQIEQLTNYSKRFQVFTRLK